MSKYSVNDEFLFLGKLGLFQSLTPFYSIDSLDGLVKYFTLDFSKNNQRKCKRYLFSEIIVFRAAYADVQRM